MFTVWFGEDPVVVLTDFALIKETFIKDGDAYAGRDFMLEINKLFKGKKQIQKNNIQERINLFSDPRSLRNHEDGGRSLAFAETLLAAVNAESGRWRGKQSEHGEQGNKYVIDQFDGGWPPRIVPNCIIVFFS
jgi:hypothetical protein